MLTNHQCNILKFRQFHLCPLNHLTPHANLGRWGAGLRIEAYSVTLLLYSLLSDENSTFQRLGLSDDPVGISSHPRIPKPGLSRWR